MIGMNDATTEVFEPGQARGSGATQQGIGLLAFWSLNRDRQHPNEALNYVGPHPSGLLQSSFEFSRIFKPFTR